MAEACYRSLSQNIALSSQNPAGCMAMPLFQQQECAAGTYARAQWRAQS